MSRFFGTGSGKAFLAGLLLIITGALAMAYDCPWGNGILITGVVFSIIGVVIYMTNNKSIDTGS